MNTVKEKKRIEELNKKLVSQLLETLEVKKRESDWTPNHFYAYLDFEFTGKVTKKSFLRKPRLVSRFRKYRLRLSEESPNITFRFLSPGAYYGEEVDKIFDDDVSPNSPLRIKWVMFAIEEYVRGCRNSLTELTREKESLEDIIARVERLLSPIEGA